MFIFVGVISCIVIICGAGIACCVVYKIKKEKEEKERREKKEERREREREYE